MQNRGIPERRRTVKTFVSPDVNEFELEALSWNRRRQGYYVANCQGCSHVICVHNSVGIIATGSSPVSGLGSEPRKVFRVNQVCMPVWLIAADCICVARKDNTLENKREKLNKSYLCCPRDPTFIYCQLCYLFITNFKTYLNRKIDLNWLRPLQHTYSSSCFQFSKLQCLPLVFSLKCLY